MAPKLEDLQQVRIGRLCIATDILHVPAIQLGCGHPTHKLVATLCQRSRSPLVGCRFSAALPPFCLLARCLLARCVHTRCLLASHLLACCHFARCQHASCAISAGRWAGGLGSSLTSCSLAGCSHAGRLFASCSHAGCLAPEVGGLYHGAVNTSERTNREGRGNRPLRAASVHVLHS